VFTINTSSVSLGASGSNTHVLFNDSKNFGFDANFYYDKTTGTLYANNVNVQSITGLDLTFDDIDGTLEASRISGLSFNYEDLEGIPVASAPTSIVVAEIAAPIESNSLYPTFFTETASVEGSSSTPYTAPGIVFDSFTGTLSVTVLTQTSDASMKYDVNRINNATDKLTKLNGVDYRWKNNSTMGSGVIAQELQTILPHLVHSDSNGQLSVNYNGLSGYIIETLKEINERLKRLENQ
jgi:hypothetical protein